MDFVIRFDYHVDIFSNTSQIHAFACLRDNYKYIFRFGFLVYEIVDFFLKAPTELFKYLDKCFPVAQMQKKIRNFEIANCERLQDKYLEVHL